MLLQLKTQFFRTVKAIYDYAAKPSSWFLLLVVIIVIGNCLLLFSSKNSLESSSNLSTNDTNNPGVITNKPALETLNIRVLDKKAANFGQTEYLVFSGLESWQLVTTQNLNVGSEYRIETSKIRFNVSGPNKYELYKYSLGVQGQLKLESVLKFNSNCDLLCQGLGQLAKLKNSISLGFFYNTCHDFYFLNQAFGLKQEFCINNAALSIGLVLGGSDNFSKSLRDDFKELGLSHLIAFSGFQVVLICSIIEFWLFRLPIGRRSRLLLIFASLIILVSLVGPIPPVLRSSISLLIGQLVLTIFGRKLSTYRCLIYSASILLIFNPLYLWNLSFQLSFMATLGTIISSKSEILNTLTFAFNAPRSTPTLFQLLKTQVQKYFLILKEVSLQSCFALLFTFPILTQLNSSFSLLSIPANTIIVPIINLLTVSNYLSLIPIIGNIFGFLNSLVQLNLLIFIQDLANLNLLQFQGFNFDSSGYFLYYLLLSILSIHVIINNQGSDV